MECGGMSFEIQFMCDLLLLGATLPIGTAVGFY